MSKDPYETENSSVQVSLQQRAARTGAGSATSRLCEQKARVLVDELWPQGVGPLAAPGLDLGQGVALRARRARRGGPMPLPNKERGATGCRRWPWTGRRGTEDASDRLRRRSDVKPGHVKAWSAISKAKNFPARHLFQKRKTPSVSISISLSVSLDRHTIALMRGFVQVDFYTK